MNAADRSRPAIRPATNPAGLPTLGRFLSANLKALVTGRLFLRNGHLPSAGHVVPEDFTGIGVATAADPEVDRAVIERLRQLGVKQVRLDYTYGDGDNHVSRFLDALRAEGFRVMLRLVQPFEAAQGMPGDAAREQWQTFVTETLGRFGDRVELIEACFTINRKRWTGYTVRGFLAAWEVAHREARERNLVLAGPSLTDFEPLWNIGTLALLAERDLLPDIHTDNLFSERCTEPERWDHKVLGHRLAPLVRYNVIRKARLLKRIGADAGTPRLMSSAAFWTLPRIERLLPDSEQKQADYVARYMILCAASGALERTCWGPLVCHREGLIDDGKRPYPKLERIIHYAGIDGPPDAFRLRPAFHALATFNRLFSGSTYEGRRNSGQDLEVHGFRTGHHRIHAVWTINTRAAVIQDLYAQPDLDAAEWLDRDGQLLSEAPALFTESPVYLRWPAAREVHLQHDAAPLPGLAIHRHTALNHYYHRDADWHGMVLAGSRAEADLLLARLHPDRIGPAPAKADSLRHARNAIWTIDDPRRPGARLVVKQPVKHHLHKKLLDRFKPSKARRSWNGASEMLRRGLDTATPVAWFEQRDGRDLTKNWYVCEYVEGGLSASKLFLAYAAGHQVQDGIEAGVLYARLADFLVRLHNRGIFFRDLSGGNILIRRTGEQEFDFVLIDTGRIHVFDQGLPMRKRLADLTRACHKLHPEGRKIFLRHYMNALGKRPSALATLRFRLYDAKAAYKRRLRKTAFYQYLKR